MLIDARAATSSRAIVTPLSPFKVSESKRQKQIETPQDKARFLFRRVAE